MARRPGGGLCDGSRAPPRGILRMSRIEAKPTAGLCYNPSEPAYWDRRGLDQEVERVFDICHGCRLCFNLCPSFPALFDRLQDQDADVRNLSSAEKQHVVELCYLCKLC